jgi:hypothetical protein
MPKKKLKAATEIPDFANDEEAADWFDTHDVSGVWNQLLPAQPVKLPPEQVRSIRERYRRRVKTAISLRLEPEHIALARRIAARKSIGYQTQLRLWIVEGIRREARAR